MPGRTTTDPLTILPVRFVVARVDEQPVVNPDWIAARIVWANRIFAAANLSFRAITIDPLESRHARLETRRDRHALGAQIEDGVINCFVVQSLRDVDEPERYRQGVHWRPRGYPGKHLVILSSVAMPTTLAHELGHFFGNRQHPDTPGNIMSYQRGNTVPFFDAAQIRRIRDFTQRFVRSRELLPTSDQEAGS